MREQEVYIIGTYRQISNGTVDITKKNKFELRLIKKNIEMKINIQVF